MAVPRRQHSCYRRGNSCITRANGEFTTAPVKAMFSTYACVYVCDWGGQTKNISNESEEFMDS